MRGKALMLMLAIGLAGSVQGCSDASRDRASYCARIAWIARGSPEEFWVLRRSIGAEGDGSITILDFYYKNGDGDRKSVEQGKSVSVRVDYGGGRVSINNNRKSDRTYYHIA